MQWGEASAPSGMPGRGRGWLDVLISCSREFMTRAAGRTSWGMLEKLWSGLQAGQPIGRIASLMVPVITTGVSRQGRAEGVGCRAAYRGWQAVVRLELEPKREG